MCGITGICPGGNKAALKLNTLRAMTDIMHHRGPDETGIYIDDHVGMGHKRLSIIDLASGTQPIHNEDRTLWIIYNGEVFNYPELRKSLLARGHTFYTTSDTEVILHLFEEKGPDCLADLNGQFAIAIWNSKDRSLFLARDRVGIRPLHYTLQDGALFFASEVKSLFASGAVPRALDPHVLQQIFTFWTPMPGQTAFKSIKELEPGHYLLFSRGRMTLHKYWDIAFAPPEDQLTLSPGEIGEQVYGLLKEASRIRLRADVPVGAYLSGGLDSSGIAAMVSRHFKNDLKTFGVRFQEAAFDEGEHQRQMADFLKVSHLSLNATNQGIGGSLARCLWHSEKPLLRTAPIPLLLLSGFVRQNDLKVVLTGEGADEIFCGYNIFRETKVRRFWAGQPSSTMRPALLSRLYPYIFNNPRHKRMLQAFFAQGMTALDDPFYSHRVRWENTQKIQSLMSADLRSAIGGYDGLQALEDTLPGEFHGWDGVAKAQYLEIKLFLSNYLLSSQGDRMAMANSLEIRLPFLDKNVIEFMARVPSHWKILGLHEKHLLKTCFKPLLPDNIVNRDKHPYRAPIQESLLNDDITVEANGKASGESAHLADRFLSKKALERTGLFDPQKVARLIKKLKHSKAQSEIDNMALVGILSTQIIQDQFIDNFPAETYICKKSCGPQDDGLNLVDRQTADMPE